MEIRTIGIVGQVLNGSFPGKFRNPLTKTWEANARLRLEVSGDADADADFEGEIKEWSLTEGQ